MVSAVSFFEPAAPAGGVHVGLSFSAAHWLRDQPTVEVPDGFYFCEATGAARIALVAQADADWTAFLEARASDLANGGRLLVQMVGSEPAAEAAANPGSPRGCCCGRWPRSRREWRRTATSIPARSIATSSPSTRAPPTRRAPARAQRVGPGRLVHGRRVPHGPGGQPVPRPVARRRRRGRPTGSRTRRSCAASPSRACGRTCSDPGSRGKSVDELTDEFFTRLTARFAADPERDRFEDWTLTVVLERRPR